MMRLLACAVVMAFAATAGIAQIPTQSAPGAVLRTLDKVSGAVADIELTNGSNAALGRLTVALGDCRFPPENAQGEAYAWVDVKDGDRDVFSGWMIASSPALSAMDHPRYDVWVLRCNNS